MQDEIEAVGLVDRERIRDRIARYSWAIDAGELDAYLACFCEDGELRHPLRDGSPGRFVGHAGIAEFIGVGFASRATQTYGTQHHIDAAIMTAEGDDVRVAAYCMVFRHEFHRQYWPRGSSWRMGTWHALMRRAGTAWKIADLEIRMWNDTAFGTGTALVNRGPGMPGVRD